MSSLGSTDGHRDFSSAQAGRRSLSQQSHRLHLTLNWPARVRNKLTLREQGSLSRSQGSLLLEPSGTIDFYFNIQIVFVYLLSTPVGGLRLILDFCPSYLVYRGIKTLNLIYFPPSNHEEDGDLVCLNPLVRSHSRLGFSMFEPPCQITQQTGISQEASLQF